MFIEEHALCLAEGYPKKQTFYHASSTASSQIDYWLVSSDVIDPHVTIADLHHLNLSDHCDITLRIGIQQDCDTTAHARGTVEVEPITKAPTKRRIDWKKTDTQLYSDLVREGIECLRDPIIVSDLDVEVMVKTLNTILYKASSAATATPKPRSSSKKKLNVWNEHIASAVRSSKLAHRDWKAAGSHHVDNDPTYIAKKAARAHMRSTIRQHNYMQKQDRFDEIMEADGKDTRLFYKLVGRQRKAKSTATEILLYNSCTLNTSEDVAAGFASHFEALATPNHETQFNEDYYNQVTFDKLIIEEIACSDRSDVVAVTPGEITKVICSFKGNKAQDIYGIAAEHFKHGPSELAGVIATLITHIFTTWYVPRQLKEGILTPVPKKNKDQTLPTNYRGINSLIHHWEDTGEVIVRRTRDKPRVTNQRCKRVLQRHSIFSECCPSNHRSPK